MRSKADLILIPTRFVDSLIQVTEFSVKAKRDHRKYVENRVRIKPFNIKLERL